MGVYLTQYTSLSVNLADNCVVRLVLELFVDPFILLKLHSAIFDVKGE